MSRYEQLRAQALKFHFEHPEVMELFERFALELIGSGRKRIGARAIWERLRWETMVNPDYQRGKQFKLNNNFHPFYARGFMKKYPAMAHVFETRVQKSKGGE